MKQWWWTSGILASQVMYVDNWLFAHTPILPVQLLKCSQKFEQREHLRLQVADYLTPQMSTLFQLGRKGYK